jgi:hypothetical protein
VLQQKAQGINTGNEHKQRKKAQMFYFAFENRHDQISQQYSERDCVDDQTCNIHSNLRFVGLARLLLKRHAIFAHLGT